MYVLLNAATRLQLLLEYIKIFDLFPPDPPTGRDPPTDRFWFGGLHFQMWIGGPFRTPCTERRRLVGCFKCTRTLLLQF